MKPLFIKYPRYDYRDNTDFFEKNETQLRRVSNRTSKRCEINRPLQVNFSGCPKCAIAEQNCSYCRYRVSKIIYWFYRAHFLTHLGAIGKLL